MQVQSPHRRPRDGRSRFQSGRGGRLVAIFAALVAMLALGVAGDGRRGSARPDELRLHQSVHGSGRLCGRWPRARCRRARLGLRARVGRPGRIIPPGDRRRRHPVRPRGDNGVTLRERDHIVRDFGPDGYREIGLWEHVVGPHGTVVIDAGQLVFDYDGNVLFEPGRHDFFHGLSSFCPGFLE